MIIRFWQDSRPYQDDFKKWWLHYVRVPILEDLLSDFGVAIMSESEFPMAIAHLYPTRGSKLIYANYAARDPELKKLEATAALKLLGQGLCLASASLGYEIIYMISDKKRLNEILREQGYFEGSQCTEFLKEV